MEQPPPDHKPPEYEVDIDPMNPQTLNQVPLQPTGMPYGNYCFNSIPQNPIANTGQPSFQPMMYLNHPLQQTVQQRTPANETEPPPNDHLTSAIFATICCFCPTGFIAIWKNNEAKNAYIRGDVAGANSSAKSAKTMVHITIIVGIIIIIISVVVIAVVFTQAMETIRHVSKPRVRIGTDGFKLE